MVENTDISISLKTRTHSYDHHRHSFRLHSSNSGMFFPLSLFSIFGFDFKHTFELKLTAFDFGRNSLCKELRYLSIVVVDAASACVSIRKVAFNPLSMWSKKQEFTKNCHPIFEYNAIDATGMN